MTYYVYIMASRSKTLYVGVTNNLERRVWEHKAGAVSGFTKRYDIKRLVCYEEFDSIRSAIRREKQLKGWLRRKKAAQIESVNPEWDDISDGWYPEQRDPSLRSG